MNTPDESRILILAHALAQGHVMGNPLDESTGSPWAIGYTGAHYSQCVYCGYGVQVTEAETKHSFGSAYRNTMPDCPRLEGEVS